MLWGMVPTLPLGVWNISMSPLLSNKLITRGRHVWLWGEQFWKESAAASPLHLRAETSAGTRSLWEQDSPDSLQRTGPSDALRNVSLFIFLFSGIFTNTRTQYLPIFLNWNSLQIHSLFPNHCRRRLRTSQTSSLENWQPNGDDFPLLSTPTLEITMEKHLLLSCCTFSLVAASWSVVTCINMN